MLLGDRFKIHLEDSQLWVKIEVRKHLLTHPFVLKRMQLSKNANFSSMEDAGAIVIIPTMCYLRRAMTEVRGSG